jgi:FkbM family methyltransferase
MKHSGRDVAVSSGGEIVEKLKVVLKYLVAWAISLILRLKWGRYALHQVLEAAMQVTEKVEHGSERMVFCVPNAINHYRATTFSTKEPETLEWIESIPAGAVLWDVGANVGLYSIYAAIKRNARVYAFEPSVFNLELLARNIFHNHLQQQITIVPIALSSVLGTSLFRMSNTTWGGALSTFGEKIDQNGGELNSMFEYQTLGVSMADVVQHLGIPKPEYIKIDVDGIEHFILRGGAHVLEEAQSVLIEVSDNFAEQAEECARHLTNAGLRLKKKCGIGALGQYNQLWVRVS